MPVPRFPRHTRRLAAVLAVAAAAPAITAGPAQATPPRDSGVANNLPATSPGFPRDSGVANNAPVAPALVSSPAPLPDRPPVAVQATDDGFDWGAAGLGGGTAAALGLLGLAGMQARTRAGTHLAG